MRDHRLWLRRLVLTLCFPLSFAGTLYGLVWAMDAAELEGAGTNLLPLAQMKIRLKWAEEAQAETPGVYRVAFFGDSTVDARPNDRSIPEQLELAVERLTQGQPPVQVDVLSAQGWGPLDYLLMADEITASRPHLVVFHFNPTSFSATWRDSLS